MIGIEGKKEKPFALSKSEQHSRILIKDCGAYKFEKTFKEATHTSAVGEYDF